MVCCWVVTYLLFIYEGVALGDMLKKMEMENW